jgi:hypothetical protein
MLLHSKYPPGLLQQDRSIEPGDSCSNSNTETTTTTAKLHNETAPIQINKHYSKSNNYAPKKKYEKSLKCFFIVLDIADKPQKYIPTNKSKR